MALSPPPPHGGPHERVPDFDRSRAARVSVSTLVRVRAVPHRLVTGLALVSVAMLPMAAAADMLELRTGERIEGSVVQVSTTTVSVETGGRTLSFARTQVRAIYFGAPAAIPSGAAREALEALKALRAALAAGVNRKEYEPRLEETRKVVDRYLAGPRATDPELRDSIQAAMRYYLIVAEAWKRAARDRTRVPSEPLLEECPGFNDLATKDALLPDSVSFPLGRGISVLWNCAGTKIDDAELAMSGAPRR